MLPTSTHSARSSDKEHPSPAVTVNADIVAALLDLDLSAEERQQWRNSTGGDAAPITERETAQQNDPAVIADHLTERGWTASALPNFVINRITSWSPNLNGDAEKRRKDLQTLGDVDAETVQTFADAFGADRRIFSAHLAALRGGVPAWWLAHIEVRSRTLSSDVALQTAATAADVWAAFVRAGLTGSSETILAWTRWLMEMANPDTDLMSWASPMRRHYRSPAERTDALAEDLLGEVAIWDDIGIGVDAVWWLLAGYSHSQAQVALALLPGTTAAAAAKATERVRILEALR